MSKVDGDIDRWRYKARGSRVDKASKTRTRARGTDEILT